MATSEAELEIHKEKEKRRGKLAIIREIAGICVVFFALMVMVIVIVDNNSEKDDLREQLRAFQLKQSTDKEIAEEKAECRRRYQALVDQYGDDQLILIGEFLVIITTIIPGPERQAAVTDKITELSEAIVLAREAAVNKIAYDNHDNPLPCPIGPTIPPPPPDATAVTTTTVVLP